MNKSNITNSREYWDNRFQTDWLERHGELQTKFFADLIVDNLPEWFVLDVSSNRMSICDWGCARGEGTFVLSQKFGDSEIVGIDFSKVAIENAQAEYPKQIFREENWLDEQNKRNLTYDVVVASNILEHFANPWDILTRTLTQHTAKHLVLLIPFEESAQNMNEEHFFRFSADNIALGWESWQCVHSKVIETANMQPTFWRGRQCLLIYTNSSWIQQNNFKFNLDAISIFETHHDKAQDVALDLDYRELAQNAAATNALKAQLATQEIAMTALQQEHFELLSRLANKTNELEQFKSQLANKDKVLSEVQVLHNEVTCDFKKKTNALEQLKSQLTDKDKTLSELKYLYNKLECNFETRINELEQLKTQLADKDKTLSELQDLHDKLECNFETKSSELEQLKAQLADKDKTLSELQGLHAKLECNFKTKICELEQLKTQLADKDKTLSEVKVIRDELTCSSKKQASELETLKTKLKGLDAEVLILQAARDELAEVKSAKSYRLACRFNRLRAKFGLYGKKTAKLPDKAGSPQSQNVALPKHTMRDIPSLKKLRVAAIMDVFTLACFEPECELITFRPDNWKQVFEKTKPDIFFVESAWNGNDASWQYRIGTYAAPMGRELYDALDWCREKGIPTVFWNKEDPPHFDKFIEAASHFEYVFTTDENCIPMYQKQCGHKRIYALPFAAQPVIHNPVLSAPRERDICFAGTFYRSRFQDRRADMEMLLRAATKYKFDIYDRMHGNTSPDYQNYLFPEEFQSFIRGRLEYTEMVEAYRRYKVFLNVNSVSASRTMFSRRVFELLASGTPVVSTKSEGIEYFFGDLVPLISKEEDVHDALNRLLNNPSELAKTSARGVREVFAKHTYEKRLRQICEIIGIDIKEEYPEKILVVLPSKHTKKIIETIKRQTHKPDHILFLAPAAKTKKLARKLISLGVKSVQDVTLAECVKYLGATTPDALVAFMSAEDYYGPGYLLDAMQALAYSNANISGMSTRFKYQGALELVNGDESIMSNALYASTLVGNARSCAEVAFIDKIIAGGMIEFPSPEYARYRYEYIQGSCANIKPSVTKQVVI